MGNHRCPITSIFSSYLPPQRILYYYDIITSYKDNTTSSWLYRLPLSWSISFLMDMGVLLWKYHIDPSYFQWSWLFSESHNHSQYLWVSSTHLHSVIVSNLEVANRWLMRESHTDLSVYEVTSFDQFYVMGLSL